MTGRPDLAAFGAGLRPMPGGAVAMALLVAAGTLLAAGRRQARLLPGLVAVAGAVLAGLWFLPGGPRISPFGAAGYLGALLALAGAALDRSWRIRQGAALCAASAAAIGALVLFSYIAGVPLRYETALVPTSLPTALVLFLVGHGLMLQAGSDTFPLALFRLERAELPSDSAQWLGRVPLAAFVALATLGGLAGALVMKDQVEASRRAAQTQLADFADYKTTTLHRWLEERYGDAESIRQAGILQERLAWRLHQPSGSLEDPGIRAWMDSLRAIYGYDAVALVDREGRRVQACGAADRCGFGPGPLRQVLASRATCLANLDREACGKLTFALWTPVLDRRGEAIGAVSLSIAADTFLRPFLQTWRGQGPSGEILLLVPGESGPGYLDGGDGQLHPLSDPAGPLGAAFARQQGQDLVVVRAGRDGRHARVLLAMRPVRPHPWMLAFQQRDADLVAHLRPRFWAIALGTLGTVLLLAFGTSLLVRRYGGLRIREKLAQERERKILAERSKVLMQEANDIILLLDLDGRILEANQRAVASYGYPLEELLGLRGQDLRPAELGAGFETQWRWLLEHGSGVWETLHRRKDGRVFPVEASNRVVAQGGATYVLSFLRDITERHAQAREIRHLSQLYAALGQVGQAVVWTRGRDPLCQRICDVLVEFGQMRGAWVDAVEANGEFRRAGSAGEDAWPGAEDSRAVVRDGRPRILDSPEHPASAAVLPVAQGGRVTHVLGVAARDRDFFGPGEVQLLEETALDLRFALDKLDEEARRARAEADLRRAEEFTENLLRTASGILVGLDPEGRVVMINEAATEITGFAREELLGHSWFETVVPRDRYPEVWEEFRLLKGGSAPRRFENPIQTKDGREKFISWQNSEVRRDGQVAGIISFGIETTQQRLAAEEQRRLEAQLVQSQKMESLGNLAGGVAHDLNNVLGAILSLASAHREIGGLPPAAAKALDTIVTACLRGRDVVRSLLYFARKGLEAERPLDLNALVRELADLLAHTTLKRVRLDLDLEDGLPPLLGDASALGNAIMNLAVNAVDAMPKGGTLTLRSAREAGGGLLLEVRDTGEGMPPEVLQRAMEPFYTTKPQGKGTGLGLSMVFGTMKAHGGALELDSRPGAGTTARLRFPAERVQVPRPEAGTEPADPDALPKALSVLVVDDDELVREATGPMLQVLGHRAHLASGGEEALDLLRDGLQVDLVILDLNMPGLSGAATLPRILELRPGQRVVLASGYSDVDLTVLQAGRPNVRSLNKPFTVGELKGLLATLD